MGGGDNVMIMPPQVGMSHLDTQMQMHMRLFRAQRNFYIAGWVMLIVIMINHLFLFSFALFLFLVIKKLVSLISANAGLQVYYSELLNF